MGSSVSKPRTLSKTLESAGTKVKRGSVNQLPSQGLKDQYEKHAAQQPPHPDQVNQHQQAYPDSQQGTPDDSLAQRAPTGSYQNVEFDAAKLKKKLNRGVSASPKATTPLPEGKDGYDPHEVGTSTYDKQYVNSINMLGRQIQSHTPESLGKEHSLALKQLKSRKQVYEEGQRELQDQHDQNNVGGIQRNMVHPRTMGAILTDIKDPRIDDAGITLDYQLNSTFVKELGQRFKVATNTVIIEEKTKDDELGHKVGGARVSEYREYDAEEPIGEHEYGQRYKKLKDRISTD